MKRLFDIIVSACGLLVLSPVFLIMATVYSRQDKE
jgi:lipopolysaccharide/colanic/teichoic acid biosynthesis glycosyltransferase